MDVRSSNLTPYCHTSLLYITHQGVIVVIIAMLTLCYSIMSHATNSQLSCIHVNATYLLNVTCTLIAIRSLKCITKFVHVRFGHHMNRL